MYVLLKTRYNKYYHNIYFEILNFPGPFDVTCNIEFIITRWQDLLIVNIEYLYKFTKNIILENQNDKKQRGLIVL